MIILKVGSTPPPTPLGFWPPDRTGLCGHGSWDVPACILLSHRYTRGRHTHGGGQLLFCLTSILPSFPGDVPHIFLWMAGGLLTKSGQSWISSLKSCDLLKENSEYNSEYTISKFQHEWPQDWWGYRGRKEVTQMGKKVSAVCRRHDCISRKI